MTILFVRSTTEFSSYCFAVSAFYNKIVIPTGA
jgi:hypothetical protein